MFEARKKLLRIVLIILCAIILAGALGVGIKMINYNAVSVSAEIDKTAEGAAPDEFKTSRVAVTGKSYKLEDDTGYKAGGANNYVFGSKPYAEVSLFVNGGEIVKGGNKNNIPAYGYVMGKVVENKTPSVELRLKYNYNTTQHINGTKWEISDDTWKSSINGISGAGVVGTGTMLVQKSYTGGNAASEWTWDNPFIKDGKTSSFHTTNFTTHYAPKYYDGKPHTWETTKEVDGETKTIKHESDGWITIYTPDGDDLRKGVYFKVLLAYEIKYSTTERTWYTLGIGTKTVWHYANVLEETKLYVCNGAANVLYQNLVFTDTSKVVEETEEEASRSEVIRMAGTILDGHATNEGFKINTNGNTSYKIEYRKDKSLNWLITQEGAQFTAPGRYTFRVTPSVGSPKYTTIYINERGIQQNISQYFANGFITDNSQRIFTDEPIPVYVAGKTWYEVKPVDSLHMPLIGRIRRVSGQKMEKLSEDDERYDKEKGGEQFAAVNVYEDINTLTAEQSRYGWKGQLDKAGEYEVEFANNPNYFEGTVSGDVYHFVFKFILEDQDTAPSMNETLLENNLCYFDYAAGYYGVSLRSKGEGNVIYAFPTYSEAYDFAYEYYRSLVKSEDGAYVFRDKYYNTQQEVLGAVTKAADGLVERRYFDPSDKESYLTVKNAAVNILTQELPRNVIVMADMLSPYDARVGEPFLNDKIYYFIDENGNPDESKVPVRFISISEFESKTVQLEYVKVDEIDKTAFKVNIGYGVPVESVLNGKNAPSGRYKITETDKYGNKNEYYAVYIKQGDVRTTLELSRTLNGVAVPKEVLSKADALTRMTANSFILNSAANELDPYGIVKIQKLGTDGYTKIYELAEVKDIIVDEEGNYVISIVDRLGNSAEFYVDIYTAKKVYTLTLMNGGEQFSQSLVSGGQKITLPVLESENNNLEFIGWADDNGNVYNGVMSFNTSSDLTLTAVFNYVNTSIEIYDGGLIESLTVKPEDKVVLPQVSKDGLTLYGFAYTQPDGSVRFYRGQITSVPNVTAMRLDAMWVDYDQTYTKEQPVRDGMIFAGWLYQNEGLSGAILEADEVEDGMTVYSLWLSEASEEDDTKGTAFLGMLGSIGSVGGGLIIAGLAALILALLAYLAIKSKKANTANGNADAAKSNSVVLRRKQVATAPVFDEYQENQSVKPAERAVNFKTRLPFRIWLKRHIIAIVACFMGCVFAFSALYKLMLPVSQKLHHDAQIAETTAKVQAAIDERNNRKPAEKYLAVANETVQPVEEKSESAYTDDESFLLANIYLNLVSLDYDVFPAIAIKQDGTQVKGFAYCSYDEAYEKDGDKERLYIGCGFLPIFGEPQITDNDTENGIEIKPILEENEQAPEYGFILSFEETFGPVHYIAYGKYVKYSVKNFSIEYTAVKNEPSAYDLELGYLYDYDLDQPIYDPDMGNDKETKYDAYSIIQGIDYEHALNAAQGTLSNQDDNFLTVDTMQVTYISEEAISEFLVHNQEESYLGIPAESLQQLESTLESNLYYYVDENGDLQLAEIPPDPEPNLFKIIFAIAQIALGAILIVSGMGTAAGLMMLAGGIISLVSDELSAILGGLGTIGNGLKCLMVGLQCITCFPVGTVVGTVMIATGIATMAFGFNDIVTAMTGRNFIQEITGMSDKAYFWCNLGLNLASTVFTVSASMAKAKGLIKCFPAGTGVLAVKANGAVEKVAIEDIKVGDRVMSYNEATGSTEVKAVTQTFTSTHEEVVKVTHSGGQTITSSVGHRYYTQRGWIGAEDLRAGDILQLVNGDTVVVESVQHEILENSQTLYNFEVDGNHNYYVSENIYTNINNFVLVHNRNCGGGTGQKFNDDQQALLDLAKKNRRGVSEREANILCDWADEYGIGNHRPMIHPNEDGIWSFTRHIKIKNIHIPIK
ncbi:MAG: InlB B-repeat-containing protein [Clostridia bacterium]|nr:InlB B-repeat-containing protein [Clostridia bacterium]